MKKEKKPLLSAVLFSGMVAGATILHRKQKTEERPQPPAPAPVIRLETELKNRLAEFLEQDRFSLMIQPMVDFRDNTVANGEALARLHHPELGVIFPDEFLPLVDAMGLYPRFDRYIFRKCCAWMSSTLAEGEPFHCLSCNFSRKTLSEAGISQELVQIADRYGVPHRALAVEITERETQTDVQRLIDNLKQLKAAGFRIFLDDYGNGVTSVNDLMEYPLDIVKIDRSLLLKADTKQGAAAFRGLVSMAAQLGAEVVCEGIETEEQNRLARSCGCRYGQGFLFFRPVAQNRVFETIRRISILEANP